MTQMEKIDVGEQSDGYHTFNELYEHRHALFLNLMACHKNAAWASELHSDGTSFEGWFLAGIELPVGSISYHLPISLIGRVAAMGVRILPLAPAWDGHTAADVVERLLSYLHYEPRQGSPR